MIIKSIYILFYICKKLEIPTKEKIEIKKKFRKIILNIIIII
jgi:hypothetical protein